MSTYLNNQFVRLSQFFEIDRAVVFGLLTRFWRIAAGPVTMVIIASFFSAEVQGYYYTFATVLALKILVEMGLSTVIIQFASHEWSSLKFNKAGQVVGDPKSLSRLISLGRLVFSWYSVGGIIIVLGLSAAGYIFFSSKPDPGFEWMWPWFFICLITGIHFCFLPVWAILQGCNQMKQVYFYQFWEASLGNITSWVAIASGAQLWTGVFFLGVQVIWSVIYLKRSYIQFLKIFIKQKPKEIIGWKKEILPMQWRIAIGWFVGGYLTFSLFTPVAFHYHGAVLAGKIGMTLALTGSLSSIAAVWTQTRVPKFGMLIAKRDYEELDRLFLKALVITIMVAILGALTLWSAIYLLNIFDHPFALRLLPPKNAGLFILTTVIIAGSVPLAVYLRAHKKEPLFIASVFSGIFTGLSTWLLGKYYAGMGMAIGYLTVQLVIIPWVIYIWYRCRKAWHSN